MDTNIIENKLQLFAELHKEIGALYLFGSLLTKINPKDIDIAILINEGEIKSNLHLVEYIASLKYEFMNLLNVNDVDVVLLNSASPIICQQVLSKGKIIFERNKKGVELFKVQIANRYHDIKLIRKPIEEQILKGRIYG